MSPRALRYLLLLLLALARTAAAGEGIAWWDRPRRGTNFFDVVETRERFRAAKAAGIGLVRLAPDKWKGEGRDFLLGSADAYRGLPAGDLARLKEVLGFAEAEGVKVVLTMLSLPGARWTQHHGGNDLRLWGDAGFRTQAIAFWRDLASALGDQAALVGYDLLNEPRPERSARIFDADAPGVAAWYGANRGAPADPIAFQVEVARAIRAVDPKTPIVIESGIDASPGTYRFVEPAAMPGVLYSFHMYEPFAFTNFKQNGGKARYPGTIAGSSWDRAALARALEPVRAWQATHGIPSSRIWASEFGVDRRVPGAAAYLADLVGLFGERGWHWAFYSFREDSWDAMDYELGTGPLGAAYWDAVERGETPPRPWKRNPLWEVLAGALATGS